MKRKRYTEEQIISMLKEHEAGASVPDSARRHGVAENTIYRWKSKFAEWMFLMPSDSEPSNRRTLV